MILSRGKIHVCPICLVHVYMNLFSCHYLVHWTGFESACLYMQVNTNWQYQGRRTRSGRSGYGLTTFFLLCMAVASGPAGLVLSGPVLTVAFTHVHAQVINNNRWPAAIR